MQTKNVVEAVRSRLGSAPGRGRTSPEIGAVSPKRRRGRLIALALAAVMAAVPISAAIQTVGASKAHAAVDDRYAWVRSAAAVAALTFWRDRAHWPATGPQNAMYHTPNGDVINGGGAYGDRDQQLRNWIGHETGNWGALNFREYDAAPRRNPWDNRGAMRYVLNVEYGLVFRSDDHYGNFTLINFGSLATPWFPDHVFCYEFPAGHANDRRIVLHLAQQSQIEYGGDTPGSAISVSYQRDWEWWHSGHGRYYLDTNAQNFRQGMSFPAQRALWFHNDPSRICQEFTGFGYGTW